MVPSLSCLHACVCGMYGPLTYAFDFCQFCYQSVIIHGGDLLITQLARLKVFR